ncbi:MAG: nitronate monooxygenase [Nesterenkonia sp.]|nr:nitronate monooxygenase [Nesterenkonia sp.]
MMPHRPLPIIAAPMAGGPSTPELVAAVGEAGGMGLLAGDYLAPQRLAEQIAETRDRTVAPFGVNLFVPEEERPEPEALEAYSRSLARTASRLGVEPPTVGEYDDDAYPAKLEMLLEDPVAVVSFTFGLPGAETVRRLRRLGTAVVLTVADAEDARCAAALSPDALAVQGTEAGGHRATLSMTSEPNSLRLDELLTQVREVTDLLLIAAGGISTPHRTAEVLRTGAHAVQVGTAYLTTREAGTKAPHRRALLEAATRGGPGAPTLVTRAFSGRPARALANSFTEEHDAEAPAGYPHIHHMTAPLRAAAARADDAQHLNLWAGTGHADCHEESAGELTRRLAAPVLGGI